MNSNIHYIYSACHGLITEGIKVHNPIMTKLDNAWLHVLVLLLSHPFSSGGLCWNESNPSCSWYWENRKSSCFGAQVNIEKGERSMPFIRNKLKGNLKAAAIKAPSFGERKSHCLDDLAILTGGSHTTLLPFEYISSPPPNTLSFLFLVTESLGLFSLCSYCDQRWDGAELREGWKGGGLKNSKNSCCNCN